MPFNNDINHQNVDHDQSQGSDLSAHTTPTKDQNLESSPNQMTPNSSEGSPNTQGSGAGGKNKSKYRRQVGADGQPKKNFYNPPGKVMRHLAQQSYYDNFYGNQGQFYTLKQKYKTQMCKHFLQTGTCPLQQYCQFAHGPTELRQSNDVSSPSF
jgi:hypothetical protein